MASRRDTVQASSSAALPTIASDASDTSRTWKDYTQCQTCFKSRADGIKLFRCTRCQVTIYCSKECQKKGWAIHKQKCLVNQNAGSEASHFKMLRAFTNKHRPTLNEAGMLSLELGADITRAQRDVLLIQVEPREGATRPEFFYRVVDAKVTPIDELDFSENQANELRRQQAVNLEAYRASGITVSGEFFVLLKSNEQHAINIVGVGFTDDLARDYTPGRPWKDWLIKRLNEGILD